MAEIVWIEPALSDLDAIVYHVALDKTMAARQVDLDVDVHQFLDMARSLCASASHKIIPLALICE